MKKSLLALVSTVAICSLPLLANAQTISAAEAAAAPAPAPPLTFNIGAVTDYRFRGISQTGLDPAIQGGAEATSDSGGYIGTWMSNIKWIKDAGEIANHTDVGSAPVEWDFYVGDKGEISKDLSYDVGGRLYYYPFQHLKNVSGSANADTFEIYGALTYSIVTFKYSHSLTTLFGFQNSHGSGYLEAVGNFNLGYGFSLAPHVGHQEVDGNGNFSYTDYSLTGAKDFGNGIVVTLAAVGTRTKSVAADTNGYAYVSPDGKNLGKSTVVLGVKYTF
jgi:uncharacterized protein (TIGR02001 family)